MDPVYQKIISAAASPWERIAQGGFAPSATTQEVVLQQRRQNWIKIATKGDEEGFNDLLKERGIKPADWLTSLQDCTIANPSQLPPWAVTLLNLLDEQSISAQENQTNFQHQLFLLSGEKALQASYARLNRAGIEITKDAKAKLLGYLNQLLWKSYHQLHNYLQTTGQLPSDNLAAGWLARFSRHPALARIYGEVYGAWLETTCEMLERIAVDTALIQNNFFSDNPVQKLMSVSCGLGDHHKGLRSVARLDFDGDRSIFYKPKYLRLTYETGELVKRLGQAGEPQLRCGKIVIRPDWAWEEETHNKPCESPQQVKDFYHRLGGWLALLQLSAGIDFWFDNLIASGADPYFIDLETFTQAKIDYTQPPEFSEIVDTLTDIYGYSSGSIGILPLQFPVGFNQPPTDIGCVVVPGKHRAPIKGKGMPAVASSKNDANQSSDSGPVAGERNEPGFAGTDEGYLLWQASNFAPYLDGEWQCVSNYMTNFCDGYGAMHKNLASDYGKTQLHRFIEGIREAPIRSILIDTFTCYNVLSLATAPISLANGVYFEASLEKLWDITDGMPLPLVQSAIDDLRQMDIPWFETRADSRHLTTPTQQNAVLDYYASSAVEQLEERMQAEQLRDTEAQIQRILSSFSTRADNPSRNYNKGTKAITSADWLDEAVQIGELLVQQWRNRGQTPPVWEQVNINPFFGTSVLGAAPRDVAFGTGGFGLFVAALYKATGMAAFKEAAQCIFDDLCAPWQLDQFIHRPQFIIGGALYGYGARLSCLVQMATYLGVSAAQPSKNLLQVIAHHTQTGSAMPMNYPMGVAGLLCVLGDIFPQLPENQEQITAIAQQLWAAVGQSKEEAILAPLPPLVQQQHFFRLPDGMHALELAAHVTPEAAGALGFKTRLQAYLQGQVADDATPRVEAVGNTMALLYLAGKYSDIAPSVLNALTQKVSASVAEALDKKTGAQLLDALWLCLAAAKHVNKVDAQQQASNLAKVNAQQQASNLAKVDAQQVGFKPAIWLKSTLSNKPAIWLKLTLSNKPAIWLKSTLSNKPAIWLKLTLSNKPAIWLKLTLSNKLAIWLKNLSPLSVQTIVGFQSLGVAICTILVRLMVFAPSG